MRISGEKTKVLSIGEPAGDHLAITLKGQTLEEVDSFSYLGSEVQHTARVDRDVRIRLEKAATVYQMWRRKVFRSQNLSRATKVHAGLSINGHVSPPLWCRDLVSNPA